MEEDVHPPEHERHQGASGRPSQAGPAVEGHQGHAAQRVRVDRALPAAVPLLRVQRRIGRYRIGVHFDGRGPGGLQCRTTDDRLSVPTPRRHRSLPRSRSWREDPVGRRLLNECSCHLVIHQATSDIATLSLTLSTYSITWHSPPRAASSPPHPSQCPASSASSSDPWESTWSRRTEEGCRHPPGGSRRRARNRTFGCTTR